ncbi:thiamine/thiamine pyrophosphate ABC transporter permease ThiP [Mesobacterium sp. TK19101]|uniref:Thiamine/thiamine pyrophosphate ABC transporter permease ThiP n=1 Tax=Mesobacterium hydrothermale TaxID=3111907 RepID=A0ABU6HEL6_9RHOB|nr:thiamine/thiamine pyrophosphate ABC transporter permease ThiP [Mesobacterium sp. TK19101]MEC3860895.1 thiamine/thiamine pyrophosphate ABC transporter permease ThiP [Mesobacterium sp. TK19101]
MAARAVAIIAALAVAGLILGPVAAVLARAGDMPVPGPADWQALRFTLTQAILSAGASVALAVPTARALARRRFPGRGLLITLLGAPFILPTIVAVLGLLAVFGNKGLLNLALGGLGVPPMSIYGLHGVVLAHVFFNLPLATRMILQGWLAIPSERLRLAASLGLSPVQVFRALELPMLQRITPQAFVVIFVICLSSFAVALTLGGGPRSTTLELAIYQSLRFDFDIARAAMLALVQLAIALTAGSVALWLGRAPGFGVGLDRDLPRWEDGALTRVLLDTLWIVAATLFLLTPLAMVVWNGIGAVLTLPAQVWQAALHSLGVALASTLLCMIWATALANRMGEWLALAGIALSPLVLGIGLFLLVRPFANPFDLALVVTALINALVSLPFAVRILRPESEAIRTDHIRLAQALGLSPGVWVTRVFLPRLRRPLGFAAGLTAALSMGDLGVIALFADPDHATLPLQIYRLMGAYRMDQAAGAAVLLLGLSLGLFWLFDRGGRADAAT